jgi:peptide/nickel transport system substrate-binding protein
MRNMGVAKRCGAVLLAAAIGITASCGGDDDDASTTPTESAPTDATVGGSDPDPASSVPPTSVSEDGPQESGNAPSVVRISPTGSLDTMDPVLVASVQNAFLLPVYEGLTALDADSVPVPSLASEWSQDGLSYTFVLRDGVTFHDGMQLDADAVVANFERWRMTPGPNAGTYADIESVEALDAQTVRVVLSVPRPTWLAELASTAGMIVSPAALDAPDLDRNPVGTGPYRYNATDSLENRYVYDRNDDYWNVDELSRYPERWEVLAIPDQAARVNALRADEIDLAAVQGAAIAELESAGVRVDLLPPNRLLALNILDRAGDEIPAFGDERVRRALAHAIDREAFVGALFPGGDGVPAMQPFADGSVGHVDGLDAQFTYDPDVARELLAEAGYGDGFEFAVPVIPPFQAYAEALAGFLAEVGVTMNIELITDDFPTTAASGDYPAFIAPHPYDDPDSFRVRYFDESSAYNPYGYLDPKLQALGEAAALAPADAPDERAPLYEQYYEYLSEQSLLIGIVQISGAVAVNEDVIASYDWPSALLAPLMSSVVAAE